MVSMLTCRLDDVVLLGYSDLQRFKVMILIDVNVLAKDIFVLPNKVKTFDSHNCDAVKFEDVAQSTGLQQD